MLEDYEIYDYDLISDEQAKDLQGVISSAGFGRPLNAKTLAMMEKAGDDYLSSLYCSRGTDHHLKCAVAAQSPCPGYKPTIYGIIGRVEKKVFVRAPAGTEGQWVGNYKMEMS